MKKRKHIWMEWEESNLVKSVNRLAPTFDGWTEEFYDAVANSINEKYQSNRKYVSWNGTKVKSKIKESKRLHVKAAKEVFAPLLLILCPTTAHSLFVLLNFASQGTSQETLYSKLTPQFSDSVLAEPSTQVTSSFSVDAMEGPQSKMSALRYFDGQGCIDIELYKKYPPVLDDKRALELFWVKEKYEEKIALLKVIYKEKYVSSKWLFGKYIFS